MHFSLYSTLSQHILLLFLNILQVLRRNHGRPSTILNTLNILNRMPNLIAISQQYSEVFHNVYFILREKFPCYYCVFFHFFLSSRNFFPKSINIREKKSVRNSDFYGIIFRLFQVDDLHY